MGLFDGLKRMLGLDSNSGATNTNAVAEELSQEPETKIEKEEPNPLPPSVNYTATEEAEELIRMWMTENNILNESFGEILHKLRFMEALPNNVVKYNEDSFHFSKTTVSISSPYRDKEYLGAINYHFDLMGSKYNFTIIFYKNSIMKFQQITGRHSFFEDFIVTSGGFVTHPKDKEKPDTLLINEYLSRLTQKYIPIIDGNGNILFKLILRDKQEEDTCSYREDEKNYYQIDTTKDSSFMNKSGRIVPFFYSKYKMNEDNNKINVYVEYEGKKVMLEVCKAYNLDGIFFEETLPLRGIACDIENSLPIYKWCYSDEFNKYVSKYISSSYGTTPRIEVPVVPENHQYKREEDIKNITDKFVITDILRGLFCNFEKEAACGVYQYPNYQVIKISTENNGEKCLELLYQNDNEKNERRVIITNNKNELVRSCISKNEDLDNNMTRRIIEVTDGTNKVALSVEGKNIKEMFDEVRLFLLLLDTFPINVNINWVWEAICNLSFRDIPNNYAKVQLAFYKDGELINKREFENNLFNKERGPVRSKNKIDEA